MKVPWLALSLCLSTALHVGLFTLAGSVGRPPVQNSRRPARLQFVMVRSLDVSSASPVSPKTLPRSSVVRSKPRFSPVWGVAHVEAPVLAETTGSGVGSPNSEAPGSLVASSPRPWIGSSLASAAVLANVSGNSEEIRPVIPAGKKNSGDLSSFSSAEGKSQANGGGQSAGLNPGSLSGTVGGSAGPGGSALGSGRGSGKGSHEAPDGDGNGLDGGEEVFPLKIVGLKKPAYPEESRLGMRGEEGTVILAVAVGVDGKREKIRIVKSSGFSRLDQAAVAALESATFVPATRGGKPVPMEKKIAFTFRLEDEQ